MIRTPTQLLRSGLAVIDAAFDAGANVMLPLYSGGYDSLSACIVASEHREFRGEVFHINTTIGSKATRAHVEAVCLEQDWQLRVYQSNFSYERYIMTYGFPGPGAHGWVYARLKERAIYMMTKARGKVCLLNGCRRSESVRRMGHTQPVRVGDFINKKTGNPRNTNRVWTSPCYDWSGEEQRSFLNTWALPRNPVKESPVAMSGECFCGAFARPGEIALLRRHVPDVAREIDRLTQLVPEGKPNVWGTRPKGQRGIVKALTGPLCSSCDLKAQATGVVVEDCR